METSNRKRKQDKPQKTEKPKKEKSDDCGSEEDPGMDGELEFAIPKEDFEAEIERVLESQNRPDFEFTPEAVEALQIAAENHVRDVFRSANVVASLNGRDVLQLEDMRVIREHFMDQNGEEGPSKKK